MTTLANVFLVATLGFIGTMFDNFFAFAAQLVVTEHSRFKRIGVSQALGVGTLVLLAGVVGSLLAPIPVRWIGLMCIAPWALAAHAWRHRSTDEPTQYRRGAMTTFMVTLGLGGDNLAVWIPLLRSNGVSHAIITVAAFALWDVVFLLGAVKVASHPRIVTWGTRYSPSFIPWVYLALGVLILVECHTI